MQLPMQPRCLRADVPALFTLRQTWLPEPDPRLRATIVLAWFRDGALHVDAHMDDDEVFNDARRHNDRTWELGDVFEIFARRDDEAAYREVHVTPDNVKLHLRFADSAQAGALRDLAEVAADPGAIVSTAARTTRGWRATAVVPLAARARETVRVSFCRYDASRGHEPVLSSSSPHPVLSFHRPWEWERCRVDG